jgi:hypothetical protein
MSEDGVLFRFADEEMVYLLRSLHITDFPGMSPEPLKTLPDEEKSLLMMEADHTLRARGLVQWRSETEREIAPHVAKLLLDCASSHDTLFVDMLDASAGVVKLLYIFSSEVIIEQCEAEPQVQQYVVIPSKRLFLQRLQTLLAPQQVERAQDVPSGHLRLDLWQEALKASHMNGASAATLLAANLPRSTAEALAGALHDFQRIGYAGRWKQTPSSKQDRPDATLTVVMGHEQLFLLWQEEMDSSSFAVMSANSEQVREYMSRLISSTP